MRIHGVRGLGLAIREQRTALGWSQQRLAEEIGASRFWVMHLERGKPTVELALVLKAVRALGLTLDILPADPRHEQTRAEGRAAGGGALVDLAAIVGAASTRRTPLRPAADGRSRRKGGA